MAEFKVHAHTQRKYVEELHNGNITSFKRRVSLLIKKIERELTFIDLSEFKAGVLLLAIENNMITNYYIIRFILLATIHVKINESMLDQTNDYMTGFFLCAMAHVRNSYASPGCVEADINERLADEIFKVIKRLKIKHFEYILSEECVLHEHGEIFFGVETLALVKKKYNAMKFVRELTG